MSTIEIAWRVCKPLLDSKIFPYKDISAFVYCASHAVAQRLPSGIEVLEDPAVATGMSMTLTRV